MSYWHFSFVICVRFWCLDNTFYVCSLSAPNLSNYIFCLEAEFKVPMTTATLKQNGPRFIAKLWIINDLIMSMDTNLKEVYEESLQQSMTMSSNSDLDSELSLECSPQKKKTKKSVT